MYHFVLIAYSLNTQVMLILILIDVLHSQKAVFNFEKGSNGQNHSSSGSHNPVKKSPHKISKSSPLGQGISPTLIAIWETIYIYIYDLYIYIYIHIYIYVYIYILYIYIYICICIFYYTYNIKTQIWYDCVKHLFKLSIYLNPYAFF